MTSQPHRRAGLDGEGVGWAVGAFVASLLIGLLVEPFRGTIGLENVVILYLLVVVAAAEGLQRLLGARRVSILRRGPAGFMVIVDIGETQSPLDLEALTHLDREGRIPPGHHRVLDGVMVLPHHVERGARAGTHHRAVHALRVVGE
jgi:hypothetical protein